MLRLSAYAMISVGVLHMFVLGVDAVPQLPGWLAFDLWTLEHWAPVASQRPELLVSGVAFWSTIGSFAIPLIILGCLLVSLDRRQYQIPAFVGWCVGIWILVASLVVEPSGFPIGIPIAIGLILGVRNRGVRDRARTNASATSDSR